MSPPRAPIGLILLVTAVFVSEPAGAEGNRLLPFWGQPYPAGYAWTRTEPMPSGGPRCRVIHAGFSRHGRDEHARCARVSHARD